MSALAKANQVLAQRRAAGLLVHKPLRKAIDAKCKDCIYDPVAPGTWRIQVFFCTVRTCPLYEVRPMPSRDWLAREGTIDG